MAWRADLVEDDAELLELLRADVGDAAGVGGLEGLDEGLGVPVQQVHGQAVLRPVPDAQGRGPCRLIRLILRGAEPGGGASGGGSGCLDNRG